MLLTMTCSIISGLLFGVVAGTLRVYKQRIVSPVIIFVHEWDFYRTYAMVGAFIGMLIGLFFAI